MPKTRMQSGMLGHGRGRNVFRGFVPFSTAKIPPKKGGKFLQKRENFLQKRRKFLRKRGKIPLKKGENSSEKAKGDPSLLLGIS